MVLVQGAKNIGDVKNTDGHHYADTCSGLFMATAIQLALDGRLM
jgi:hypothetical protein